MAFNIKKLLGVSGIALVAGLALAGCGRSIHHATKSASHDATERVAGHKAGWHKHEYSARNDTKNHKSAQDTNKSANLNQGNNVSRSQAIAKSNENTPKSEVESSSLPTVNLGHGVTGQIDRGAGQVYVSFTYNGQQYMSHGNDVSESADTAVDNARGIVNRLSNE